MFQCRPLAGAWKLELVFSGGATCIVYGDFIVGYEISNMLLDIIILCLPIWQIKRLQLPTAKKLVIGGVFILGGFVCMVCIIRISYLNSAQTQNPVSLSNGMNWSTVELAVAILCACLPCYGPFLPTEELSGKLDRWYRSWRTTRSHGLKSKGGPGYCRFGPPSDENHDSSYDFTREGGIGRKPDAYPLD
ncbi:MAG: hypothetical protein L6R35_000877 [Caloplaca aegaea]|nr:MAG: hypothetical protein L6R35_000877 [Caloplaca aegaea]